jgi:hypothetical protein
MKFEEVLQAINGKAGKKGYFVSVRVSKKNGDICDVSISMDKVMKPKEGASKMPMSSYDSERDGKIEISVTERTEVPPPDGGKGENMLKQALKGMDKGKMKAKAMPMMKDEAE